MKSTTFISVIFILFSGCTKNDESINVGQTVEYSIDQSRSCFCPQAGEPVRLFVVADTIADAVWIKTNSHLTPVEWQRFRSIKGLFNEITLWDTSSIFKVIASYDPFYHYPSKIDIEPKPIIVNDTIVSIITDVGVVYTTWNYTKYK
jgi:hypothetical protein